MILAFELVDAGWAQQMDAAATIGSKILRIVCPFVQRRAMERLVRYGFPPRLEIITRFNLQDFADGVSDLAALKWLLERGARIRGIRNLHAKLYVFGETRAIVTSANLTEAALVRNHEFGFVSDDGGIVERCSSYFDALWARAGQDLDLTRVERWQREILGVQVRGAPPDQVGRLGDEGAEVGLTVAPPPATTPREDVQAFIKFFGDSHHRAVRSLTIEDEVKESGPHWACTYPFEKRPRKVRDGAVMFIGRLVKDPQDIVIYGRAVALSHRPGRDDATPADIAKRPWKATYPHYIRVHHAEFVAGNLATTQRNATAGLGNVDPRRAYLRQAQVELSPEGLNWVSERLQSAFERHGKLSAAFLQRLDWPDVGHAGHKEH